MKAHERIILPLDVSNVDVATNLVNQLHLHVGVFKVGFEAIYSMVAEFVMSPEQALVQYARKVRTLCKSITPGKLFLDVKLADISNTVEQAMKSLSRIGARMVNIHASGGAKMIKAAAANKGMSQLFGVTILTSIDPKECRSIFGAEPGEKVLQFAEMLLDNGADGVICAPAEGLLLRQNAKFDRLKIATPNVRPLWTMTVEERARVKDDQDISRQLTPAAAVKSGIDMLVIGRPITKPPAEIGGPVEAAKLVAQEIAEALGEEV